MSDSPDNDALYTRLASLVRRELGAEDVRLLRTGEPPPEAVNVLTTKLPDGRVVAVTFADAENRPSLERRLDILVHAFADSVEEGAPGRRSRPPATSSLREELRALAARAQAVDALVLDARSPIVWGAGRTRIESTEAADPSAPKLVDVSEGAVRPIPMGAQSSLDLTAEAEDMSEDARAIVERAIRDIRALPEVNRARKGKPFRHIERTSDFGFVVHAFAGIYLLALVFSDFFDEVRAERSIAEALPRVERLVLVLPPLDPTPGPNANVIHMKRPRRRG
ncbi:MAG: hypothetical protein ACRELY_20400 [Polyangiaceae bacterium]